MFNMGARFNFSHCLESYRMKISNTAIFIFVYFDYDEIIGTIVGMINHPETWILKQRK